MMASTNSSPSIHKKSHSVENMKIAKQVHLNPKRSVDCSPDDANKKRLILCNITNAGELKTAKYVKIAKGSTTSTTSIKSGDIPPVFLKKENEPLKSTLKSIEEVDISNISTDSLEDSVIIVDEPETKSFSDRNYEIDEVPSDIEDFDAKNAADLYSESKHAPYIFKYYLMREDKFKLTKYLDYQKEVTRVMRAVLVDWMVEVQENFELNHETLYLAVKLVDMYLMKHQTMKSDLQLVGATALLIASKYDERMPPLVDDFLYICDDSYKRAELLAMEIKILTTVKMDLGIPISYRFLRRFARCSQVGMDTLTLARFVLEMCLMDYELIDVKDSKMAAAALLLALKMKGGTWSRTSEFYTGYAEEDLMDLVKRQNRNISASVNKHLVTIRVKYSHKVFFEVTKVPPLEFKD